MLLGQAVYVCVYTNVRMYMYMTWWMSKLMHEQ